MMLNFWRILSRWEDWVGDVNLVFIIVLVLVEVIGMGCSFLGRVGFYGILIFKGRCREKENLKMVIFLISFRF